MRKLPKTISETEFLDIVKKVKNPQYKIAFMLGFYQCMRISEICALKTENIDTSRGFIHIIAGKGNKDRDIPITKPIERGLKYIPVNIGIRGLQKAFKKYAPDLHFHTLRHSGASFYLNDKKLDIRYIQQLLGHSRLDTTQIYTHVTPENLKNQIDNIF